MQPYTNLVTDTLRSINSQMLKHLRFNKTGQFYVLRGPNQGTRQLQILSTMDLVKKPGTFMSSVDRISWGFLFLRGSRQETRTFYVLRGLS